MSEEKESIFERIMSTAAASLIVSGILAVGGFIWAGHDRGNRMDQRISIIEGRQIDLRQQLRCDPHNDPHPLCARIESLEKVANKFHGEAIVQ